MTKEKTNYPCAVQVTLLEGSCSQSLRENTILETPLKWRKGFLGPLDPTRTKKVRAELVIRGRPRHLGYFSTQQAAIDACYKAAIDLA